MATTDDAAPGQLKNAKLIPIAELGPEISDSSLRAVQGVVTIVWPYNSVKNTIAFTLAEPDFRRRRTKGQARVNFAGASARAVADLAIGSADEVLLGLGGVEWAPEDANRRQSLPGAGIDWQLNFACKTLLQVKLDDTGETKNISVDSPGTQQTGTVAGPVTGDVAKLLEPTGVDSISTTESFLPLSSDPAARRDSTLTDNEYKIPATTKRGRASYGALWEDEIFEQDGGVKGKGRKKTRFGRHSGAWRYSSQSPSPETDVSQHGSESDKAEDHETPSLRPSMTDMGSQILEFDISIPEPPEPSLPMEIGDEAHNPITTPLGPSYHQGGTSTQDLHTRHMDWWHAGTQVAAGDDRSTSFDLRIDPDMADSQLHQGLVPTSEAANADVYSGLPSTAVDHSQGSAATNYDADHPESKFDRPESYDGSQSLFRGNGGSDIPPQSQLMSEHPETASLCPSLENPGNTIVDRGIFDHLGGFAGGHRRTQDHSLYEQESRFADEVRGSVDRDILPISIVSESWTTINQPSSAGASQPTDLPGRGDTQFAESAIVDHDNMSEGESENKESQSATAVEGTVRHGRSVVIGGAEGVQCEDELDDRYSGDDELDNDTDDLGDYDTRNYNAPDDDEDDSHDEDLQDRDAGPMLDYNEEQSWDEEEDEDEEDSGPEDLGDEYIYESDPESEEMEIPSIRPQSIPEVIDLLSSSEEEEAGNPKEGDQVQEPDDNQRRISSSQVTDEGSLQRLGIVVPPNLPDFAAVSDGQHESLGNFDSGLEGEMEESHEIDRPPHHVDQAVEGVYETKTIESESLSVAPDTAAEESSEFLGTNLVEVQKDSRSRRNSMSARDEAVSPSESEQSGQKAEVHDGAATGRNVNHDVGASPTRQAASHHEVGKAEWQLKAAEAAEAQDAMYRKDSNTTQTLDEESPRMSPQQPSTPSGGDKDADLVGFVPSSPPLTQLSQYATRNENDGHQVQETTLLVDSNRPSDQLPTPLDTQATDAVPTGAMPENMEADAVPSSVDGSPEEVTASMEIQDNPSPEPGMPPQPVEPRRELRSNGETQREASEAEVEKPLGHAGSLTAIDSRPMTGNAVALQASSPMRGAQNVDTDEPSPSSSFESQLENDFHMEKEAGADDAHQAVLIDSQDTAAAEQPTDAGVTDDAARAMVEMEIDEMLSSAVAENERPEESVSHESLPKAISPDLGSTPTKARGISSELNPPATSPRSKRNAKKATPQNQLSSEDNPDPSIQLARAALGSRPSGQRRDKSGEIRRLSAPQDLEASREPSPTPSRPQTRSREHLNNPTPEKQDASVQLAKAALNSPSKAEDGRSISLTAAKMTLVRHLRDELSDYSQLKVLRNHIQNRIDVLALAMMKPPEARRSKTREYMLSFTVTDHTIAPGKVVEVQFYRPHKESLPVVRAGDVVLLRKFTVVALTDKGFGLRTNDASAWAVFDRPDEPHAQIKGPPVEYGAAETEYAALLRTWFALLDPRARTRLDKANENMVHAGTKAGAAPAARSS